MRRTVKAVAGAVAEEASFEGDYCYGSRNGRQADSQWSRQSQVSLGVQAIFIAGRGDAVVAWPAKLHPAGASLRKTLETQGGKVKPEALFPLARAAWSASPDQGESVANADESQQAAFFVDRL